MTNAASGLPGRAVSAARARHLGARLALASALGLAACVGPVLSPTTRPAPRESALPTARVHVADSCPGATQLEWPGPRGEVRLQLVLEPGCTTIAYPPGDATRLRARCVSLDENWTVAPTSAWVTGRSASSEERARLCREDAAEGTARDGPAPPGDDAE